MCLRDVADQTPQGWSLLAAALFVVSIVLLLGCATMDAALATTKALQIADAVCEQDPVPEELREPCEAYTAAKRQIGQS